MEDPGFDLAALIQVFSAEASENFSAMEDALLLLERAPDDREAIDTVFRMAHSIKGDASCVGFTAMADFAHELEDLLERVRERSVTPSSALITLLLAGLDSLRALLQAGLAGRHELTARERELAEALGRVAAGADVSAALEQTDIGPYAASGSVAPAQAAHTLRVDTTRLDQMVDFAGEIAIARGRLRQALEAAPADAVSGALEAFHDSERLFLELQDVIMRVRMVPVGPLFRQHARVVRDIAAAEGKSAALLVEGADAEIDNSVIEELRQPLTHMLRNAVHHGMETREERLAAGKPPHGTVTLRAFHEPGTIVIQVVDDGRGVDREALLRRAIAAGIVAESQKLSDAEVLDLVFRPGISTAARVTEISGRGVGMDVVKRNVESLHGSVTVESVAGEGTTVTIRLPLTLAIIDGFSVTVGGERYIVPLEFVVECTDFGTAVERARVNGVMELRGDALPYVDLTALFDLPHQTAVRRSVVVVHCRGERAGFIVDALHGQVQAVIKPLSALFRNLPSISGSAILGDGHVAMILDVPSVIALGAEA